jgi:hypothetical protein
MRRESRRPEQLASGVSILALDPAGRAKALVAAYVALGSRGLARAPTKGGMLAAMHSWTELIMLGLLITALLRKRLPLRPADLEKMAEHAARARSPAVGLDRDWDMALVKELARHERLSPRVKVSLRKLAARRGVDYVLDRRVVARCEELASR